MIKNVANKINIKPRFCASIFMNFLYWLLIWWINKLLILYIKDSYFLSSSFKVVFSAKASSCFYKTVIPLCFCSVFLRYINTHVSQISFLLFIALQVTVPRECKRNYPQHNIKHCDNNYFPMLYYLFIQACGNTPDTVVLSCRHSSINSTMGSHRWNHERHRDNKLRVSINRL